MSWLDVSPPTSTESHFIISGGGGIYLRDAEAIFGNLQAKDSNIFFVQIIINMVLITMYIEWESFSSTE